MATQSLRSVLAFNLRCFRRAARLSQRQLAAVAGINRNYVGMIERQEHAATVDMIECLAAALEIGPLELLRGRPPKV